MDEQARHDENVRMLERLLKRAPSNPDLYLLLARTLRSLDRYADWRAALRRAAGCGDAAVLTRVASMCFYAGELEAARRCIDRHHTLATACRQDSC